MALSKVDPKKVFKTVSTLDPAIDKDATGEKKLEEYSESYDMSLLKFKTGEFPTVFHVNNILSSDEAKIKQDHLLIKFPELEGATEETLKNVKIKDMKPEVTQVKSQEMMVKYFNYAILNYEENNEMFPCSADMFPYAIVQEIGAIIIMRTQVGDDLKNALGS